MTQSLSILMNELSPGLVLLSGLLLLSLLVWSWFRYRQMAKKSIVAQENCPAIPSKKYQLSEVRQSSLKPSTSRAQQLDKVVSTGSEDYHIPPDLWDV